jgi:hypothetical protein
MKKTSVLVAAVLAVVVTAVPAKACSCALGDPRDALEAADAAFIGTLLSQAPNPEDEGQTSTYTFTVDEEVKGQLGETVEVQSSSNGASCGLEVPIGGQTGLFLDGDAAQWSSSLCAQIDPEELRAAAEPLPEPDGVGPIKMLVSGSYGEMGIMALDSEGRTLAYGEREPRSGLLHVCPGSHRFLEIFGEWNRPQLAVRDTESLDVLRTVDLEFPQVQQQHHFSVVALSCNRQADVIYVAGMKESGDGEDVVLKITPNDSKRIYRAPVGDFHFVGTDLYLTEGGRARFLVKLDLAGHERDGIATVPNRSTMPRVSPNGRWVVLRTAGDRMKLVVVDTETGDVRSKTLGVGVSGEAVWVSNRKIALLPGGYDNSKVQIFSRSLDRLDTLSGPWYTNSNFVAGNVAYGIGWGALYRAELPGGPAEQLRIFDSPEIYFIAGVPDEVSVAP